jgi:hypothetical protein
MNTGIFATPTALSGKVLGMGADDKPAAFTGPRTYSPGFRPWIPSMRGHLPNSNAWSGLGSVLPNSIQNMLPSSSAGILAALGVAALAVVAGGVVIYSLMGYYVGKRLGTRWGWFYGLGGPIGIGAMAGYRQLRGRASPGGDATPNRRRRRRRSRRRHHRRAC